MHQFCDDFTPFDAHVEGSDEFRECPQCGELAFDIDEYGHCEYCRDSLGLYDDLLRTFTNEWADLLDTSQTGNTLGNCYRNSAEFVIEKKEFGGSLLKLAHADVRHPETGDYHGHAFVVWGDGIGMVIDPSNGRDEAGFFALPDYFRLGCIDPDSVKYYSREDAMRMSLRFEHWGPWPEDDKE